LTDHLPLDGQAYRPTVVFLNGEYWGVHNLRERQDENFLAQRYGVDPDRVVIREGYGANNSHYQAMLAYITANGAAAPEHYAHIQTQMDVDNFVDYNIAEIYFGNHEWPWANVRFWRYTTDEYEPDAPYGHDGRWRWLMTDADKGFGYGYDLNHPYYERNTLRWATNPNGNGYGEHTTFLLRSLLENDVFRINFINRFADQMNTAFLPERTVSEIDLIWEQLYPEMSEHIARYGQPPSFSLWNNYVQIMRDYATYRSAFQRQHIVNHFGLSGTAVVALHVDNPDWGLIQINSILLDTETVGVYAPVYPWQGVYFQDTPIKIKPIARPGYRFLGWSGPHVNSLPLEAFTPDGGLIVVLNGDIQLTAQFDLDEDFLPRPHILANGAYHFNGWSAAEPAETYPANMIFEQTDAPDPGLNVAMDSYWGLPYNLESRSRIVGLGDDGVGFINTGNAQDTADAGYVGTAVLALNSFGRHKLQLSWTGGTVLTNNREYGLRLQYRLGAYGPFHDLLDAHGQPIEYLRHATAGHETIFTAIELPAVLANQRYAQIRWRYYYTGAGDSGPRAMLRLDDITVVSEEMPIIYLPIIRNNQ
jgi:hypothetical protein